MTLSIAMTGFFAFVVLTVGATPTFGQIWQGGFGVVTPAVGQTLRVTVENNGASDTNKVRFAWTQYGEPVCSGMPTVCRHVVDSQGATPNVILGNDALSIDVQGSGYGISVVVESKSKNVRVRAMIIDNATGRVVAVMSPADGCTA
jgi:hypothetical protein